MGAEAEVVPTPEPRPASRLRIAAGCGAMLVGFAAVCVLVTTLNTRRLYRQARQASVSALLSAGEDLDRLRDATGSLGVVLRPGDGSWIAIRYADSHAPWSFYSCAVARCSDGTWLQSDHHFCGEFGAYRFNQGWLAQETSESGRAAAQDALRAEYLHAVESAPDLAAAITLLRDRGFRAFTPPGRSR